MLRIVLLLSFISMACTHQTQDGAVLVYEGMQPTKEYRYVLAPNAPPKAAQLLSLAVAYWNQELGGQRLQVVSEQTSGNVNVSYNEVQGIEEAGGHTKLLGCMAGFNLIQCQIVVNVPSKAEILSHLSSLMHLYQPGPLDKMLLSTFSYKEEGSAYFQDKMAFLSLVHEIGHTLGLGHADSQNCIMAAKPNGHVGLCADEIAAAHHQMKRGINGLAAEPSRRPL